MSKDESNFPDFNSQAYLDAVNQEFNRDVDPKRAEKGQEYINSTSTSDTILNWLRLWKCTNSTILQKLVTGLHGRSEAAYLQSLKRLKQTGLYSSVRVGAEAYYFQDSYKNHSEKLAALDPLLRKEYLESSGLRHHIEVQHVWLWTQVINARIKGLLFIEGPDGLETKFRAGISKKPDLCLVTNFGTVPIEVERNIKSKERWFEKWLEYECDPDIPGCLYFVSDHETCDALHRNFLSFFEQARKRNSTFWLAMTWPFSMHIVKYSIDENLEGRLATFFFDRLAVPRFSEQDFKDVPDGDLLRYLSGAQPENKTK